MRTVCNNLLENVNIFLERVCIIIIIMMIMMMMITIITIIIIIIIIIPIDLKDGDVFMMAVQKYAPKVDYYSPTDAYDAYEKLVFGEVNGESIFRAIDLPDTYATVYQKGRCAE